MISHCNKLTNLSSNRTKINCFVLYTNNKIEKFWRKRRKLRRVWLPVKPCYSREKFLCTNTRQMGIPLYVACKTFPFCVYLNMKFLYTRNSRWKFLRISCHAELDVFDRRSFDTGPMIVSLLNETSSVICRV